MTNWNPKPRPGGIERDETGEPPSEIREPDLPGSGTGPDHPPHRPEPDEE